MQCFHDACSDALRMAQPHFDWQGVRVPAGAIPRGRLRVNAGPLYRVFPGEAAVGVPALAVRNALGIPCPQDALSSGKGCALLSRQQWSKRCRYHELQLQRRLIAIHYVTTYFILDLLTTALEWAFSRERK